ncbi:helix-turn-helix domain-containing protein [Microbacterium sp. A8/3-1]|uniref:Helix-turn-helix domain-containing protein n=1 Tax=Microbacterium sp. A8/3-1 TaxID=3160749 RepID=A0AAU7VUU0_9MICO
MADPTRASPVATAALVRGVVSATRSEPGESTAALAALLAEADVAAAEVEELLASVQEAQQLTARLRRRATELEALFSTARELVRLQDVTDVLRRLVERAHELMGTDVTYLSEVDDAQGDLRVRYSVGTVTPEFRDLLVPAGYGLASLVANSREPVWVRQYARMADAPHDASIDAAVEREGLVSFLGVPLAVGDEVLGALFACNRFAHDFTPDQVLLLSAFADHAAAVLHSARVLADSATARARAEQAYRELHRHLEATQVASSIHEQLTAAVMSGATVVDLVSTLSDRLGRRVWALDDAARPLGASAGPVRGLPARMLLTGAVRESQRSGHAATIDHDGGRWLVVAILGADRVLGAIVAERGGEDPPDDDVVRPTLERAAHVAALVSFKRDAASALRAERRARALLAVIEGETARNEADLRAEFSAEITACAVVDVQGREGALTAAADAVGDDGIVAVRGEYLIVAWGVPEATDETERMRRVLADRLRQPDIRAVVAVAEGTSLRAAVDRATRDLRLLVPLGITDATVRSDAFAPYHVLTSAAPDAVARFVDEVLGRVREWDSRRGTALVETLAAYFDGGGSRQAAAASLRVHKNTVQQRLERIWTLLEGDWDDAEYRFRVQAAVRLENLRVRLIAGR